MSNNSTNILNTSESSMIQKLLKYSADPRFISFALGFPSADILPSYNFMTIAKQVLDQRNSLQYQPPSSDLKKIIVDLMIQKNINCSIDEVFLTSGAQQGLSVVSSLLLSDKKSYVLTEELVYTGFLQAIKPFNTDIITFPVNYKNGFAPLLLREVIKNSIRINKKPSLIYLISEGHNPLGINISYDNIMKIRDILEEYQIFAIEDDPYGFISYEGKNVKLKSLLPDLTFYVGSLSKILAPSLRIGWIIAPKLQVQALANIKEGADLNISTFSQKLVSQFMHEYSFEKHIDLVQNEYKRKRDIMVDQLNKNFADQINFITPASGMFIWVNFKGQINSEKLLESAIEEKVVYLPGNSFVVDKKNENFNSSMRLCFTLCSDEQIIEGIRKLKIAFDKMEAKS